MKIRNKEEYNNLLKKIQDGEVLEEEKEKELKDVDQDLIDMYNDCLLYTSPSPRD